MKKSADSNNTTAPLPSPVFRFIPQRFPSLVSNHVPAQTRISVFLESVNEMHTLKKVSARTLISLPSTGKQPLNSKKVSGLQPAYEEATTL